MFRRNTALLRLKIEVRAVLQHAGEQKMDFGEVRKAIITEWLALPSVSRRSMEQATAFATKMAKRHGFPPGRDPLDLILRWLDPHIPEKQ